MVHGKTKDVSRKVAYKYSFMICGLSGGILLPGTSETPPDAARRQGLKFQ